jgi:predicted outer membrane protein
MKLRQKLVALAAAGLVTLGTAAQAADLYVISNSGTTISASDIREVFLGEKQFAGSIKLVPVDNAAVQEQFLARVMKMEAAKYASSWTKKSFRDGVSPPAIKGSDADTIEFVKQTAGAVGYVGTSPAGVNVVGKF